MGGVCVVREEQRIFSRRLRAVCINPVDRIVAGVWERINRRRRVLAQETARCRVVVSSAGVIEAALLIVLVAGEGLADRLRTAARDAEAIVRVACRNGSGAVAHRSDAA